MSKLFALSEQGLELIEKFKAFYNSPEVELFGWILVSFMYVVLFALPFLVIGLEIVRAIKNRMKDR